MKFDDFADLCFEDTVAGEIGDAIYEYLPGVIAWPILVVGFIFPTWIVYALYHLFAPPALRKRLEK